MRCSFALLSSHTLDFVDKLGVAHRDERASSNSSQTSNISSLQELNRGSCPSSVKLLLSHKYVNRWYNRPIVKRTFTPVESARRLFTAKNRSTCATVIPFGVARNR